MLTPRFSCSQTTNSVVISIYVPSVRAADVEIHVDGTLFSLHINPYFLRLSLPKPVQEDDASSAKYDPSSGYLTVTLTKEVPGQYFEDLDLLAKLLAARPVPKAERRPVIEVINDDTVDHLSYETERLNLEHEVFLEAAKTDWQLPQHLPGETPQLATTRQQTYGFLDMHSGYFRQFTNTENEANELGPDAEVLSEDERRRRGEECVDNKFDEDYYLADFVNDEEIQELIRWRRPCSPEHHQSHEFSDDEKLTMLRLPRREYLPTASQTVSLYYTLVMLLFSIAYDTRTTLADPTSESAWTLSVLTPAFASLSPAHAPENPPPSLSVHGALPILGFSVTDALVPSYKRGLAFPLYRSFALCERCRLDAADVLAGGRRTVLKALLGMKRVLDKHDAYYVYSKIWVDDFCVWVQSLASDEWLHTLSAAVRTAKIKKQELGWDLDVLEQTAREAMERAPDSDDDSEDEMERMQPAVL